MLQGLNILVTGGAGSIGSELVRQLCPNNRVFILDNNETGFFDLLEELKLKGHDVDGRVGDVRNWKYPKDLTYPDYIFHAAALKHVTPSAWSPEEYVKTNIMGTLNMIALAKTLKAKLINVSTDKVVASNSIMSATKKVAEVAVRDAGFVSVRFGNVLGSRGSVLEIWKRQMDRNEPLTVTDINATRYMMTIPQAVSLIIKAAEEGIPGEIMVLDMGQKANIYELATKILAESGSNAGIKMIGLRPGETLSETLMSSEEEARSVKRGGFYVIH